MKRLALLIASLFLAGLFTAGTALGMSHEDKAMDEKKDSAEYQHPTLGDVESREATDPLAARDLDEDQIRELESILQDEGYEIGQSDGQLGLEDREALREFQREEGLAITGEPNEETLRALSTDVEQQEFFGLSPEFGPGDEGVLEDDKKLEEQRSEEVPTLDQRIEEKPETKQY